MPTLDVDLVVELREEQVPSLLAALGEGFYADEVAGRARLFSGRERPEFASP